MEAGLNADKKPENRSMFFIPLLRTVSYLFSVNGWMLNYITETQKKKLSLKQI
jgi:hypothetical protein